jgi:hypothetical protein
MVYFQQLNNFQYIFEEFEKIMIKIYKSIKKMIKVNRKYLKLMQCTVVC